MSDNLIEEVQHVFHSVFNDSTLVINTAMTAADIDGWDSLTHLNLVIALEQKFRVKFTTAEISRMKDDGENVGTLITLLDRKLGKR